MDNQPDTVFNRYYREDLKKIIDSLSNNSKKVTYIDSQEDYKKTTKSKADYYVSINAIGSLADVQTYFNDLRSICNKDTRVIIVYFNYLWEPVLKLAEVFGLKKKQTEQNWLALDDIVNLLSLSDFSVIKKGTRFLFPVNIPVISYLVNNYLAKLPLINKLCLTNYLVARPVNFKTDKKFTVSVIVPARNEEGNIPFILKRMLKMGKRMEMIFVEGHSKDKTWHEIQKLKTKYPKQHIRTYRQRGIGKADAVRLGITKAKGDIIIILDADLSVAPEELPKFYNVLAEGRGEFANGSRLVYPLEHEAMRFLNKIGNKLFSLAFSWILKQRFTDTLCGTKAFWRKDYQKILNLKKIFGDFDPFGDYELIFGATKLNLEVVEVPIKYHARSYGKTNISRFTHGFLLFKMCWFAFKKLKLES